MRQKEKKWGSICNKPSVSEGTSDPNDRFNLPSVRVATVDVVMHSSDGSQEGLVGGGVICEWDGCLHSSEWRAVMRQQLVAWFDLSLLEFLA